MTRTLSRRDGVTTGRYGPEMLIRHVRPEDAGSVAALLGELGYPTSAADVEARLARLAPSDNDSAWVLVDQDRSHHAGNTVGFVAGHVFWPYELDQPVAEVTALVVSPTHRSAGAGRSLVTTVEDWATALGCCRVSVASAFHRDVAHAFYNRLGYRQLARKFEKGLEVRPDRADKAN